MEIETGQREAGSAELFFACPHCGRTTNVQPIPVTFCFSLEQDIKITALKLPARIVGRGERIGGHVYLVVWWAENKRYEAWLYEHELEG